MQIQIKIKNLISFRPQYCKYVSTIIGRSLKEFMKMIVKCISFASNIHHLRVLGGLIKPQNGGPIKEAEE